MLKVIYKIIRKKWSALCLKGYFKNISFNCQEKFLVKQPLGYRSLLWELLSTLKNNGQKLLQLETWGAAKSKRAAAVADVCTCTSDADVCTSACISPYQGPLLAAYARWQDA